MQAPWACAMAFVHALGGVQSGDNATESRVAVLPVQTRSTLPEPLRERLRDTIAQGVERADDVQLVGAEAVNGEPGADACEEPSCASDLAEALDAAWVLQPTITRVDSVYDVRLDAIDAHGRTLASVRDRCEICGQDEVTELVVDRSAALAAKVQLLQRQAPQLVLRSEPSGAKVRIDGRFVGRTPLELDVAPGEHEVRMELRGHEPERRRVIAVAGTEDTLEVVLDETPGLKRPALWRGLGAAGVATGVPAIAAGVVLASLDEREYERRCHPDPLGQCSHRYATLEGGIALMLGGGVLLAAGMAALIVARHDNRAGSPQASRWRVGRGLAIAF